jgi:hypothetical protein
VGPRTPAGPRGPVLPCFNTPISASCPRVPVAPVGPVNDEVTVSFIHWPLAFAKERAFFRSK